MDPNKVDVLGSDERKHEGKPYRVIFGKLKSDGSTVEQAYRYPKDVWTAAEARAHCESHNCLLFEPAATAAALQLDFITILHKLEASAKGNLATFYLMNSTRNRNKWGVTSQALEEALPTLIGKSLGVGPGYVAKGHPANPVPVGKFVKFSKPNGYATGTVDVTDPKAWQLLQSGKLGPISAVIDAFHVTCSRCGTNLSGEKNPVDHPCIQRGEAYAQVHSFTFDHFDFVDVPAYPQAGVLKVGAGAQAGVMLPIELCAGVYDSQSLDNLRQEGKKMDEKETQELNSLRAAKTEWDKEKQTLEARITELEKNTDAANEVKTLKAKLDTIEKAAHAKVLAAAVDARFAAGLATNKDEETERLKDYPDAILEGMAAEAVAIAKKLQAAAGSSGPRIKYEGATKEEDDALLQTFKARREELGFPARMEAA